MKRERARTLTWNNGEAFVATDVHSGIARADHRDQSGSSYCLLLMNYALGCSATHAHARHDPPTQFMRVKYRVDSFKTQSE